MRSKLLGGFRLRFDGMPDHEGPQFVEAETLDGQSFRLGAWEKDEKTGQGMLVVEPVKFKPVYVAWVNSDLTEGRGWSVPLCVCKLEATAKRRGVGQNVQGTDAEVTYHRAYQIDGHWYAPTWIEPPSDDDIKKETFATKMREAMDKARSAGLTDEDIAAIIGGVR